MTNNRRPEMDKSGEVIVDMPLAKLLWRRRWFRISFKMIAVLAIILAVVFFSGTSYIKGMFNNSFYQYAEDRHHVKLEDGKFQGVPAKHESVKAIHGDEMLDFVILNHHIENPDIVVLQYRGNWGPLTHKSENLAQLVPFAKEMEGIRADDPNSPYARKIVYIGFDPPSSGGSTGEANMDSVERAALTALKFKEEQYPGVATYIICHSLGGNIFLHALNNPGLDLGYLDDIKGVIIDSTFYSYRVTGAKNAGRVHPILGWLSDNMPFVIRAITKAGVQQHVEDASAMNHIGAFLERKIPTMILQDTDDPTVSYSISLAKYMLENKLTPKHVKFEFDNAGGHIDFFASEEFRKSLFNFFLKYRKN